MNIEYQSESYLSEAEVLPQIFIQLLPGTELTVFWYLQAILQIIIAL